MDAAWGEAAEGKQHKTRLIVVQPQKGKGLWGGRVAGGVRGGGVHGSV